MKPFLIDGKVNRSVEGMSTKITVKKLNFILVKFDCHKSSVFPTLFDQKLDSRTHPARILTIN